MKTGLFWSQLAFLFYVHGAYGMLNFTIDKAWDGDFIHHRPTQISLDWKSGDEFMTIHFSSEYFFDPPPSPGPPSEPYPALWNYEVAEIFFLAPNNKYLEVEVSPHGKYLVILLNGQRNQIKDMLRITYTAVISETSMTWVGTAEIPLAYLPHGVSKVNAYAIHGTNESRQYEALYPVPKGKFEEPDFHRLEYFKEFNITDVVEDTSLIGMYWDTITPPGTIFHDSGEIQEMNITKVLSITKTWDGDDIHHIPTEIQTSWETGDDFLTVTFTGQLFYDPAPPSGPPGEPYPELWKYEVAEIFFLASDNKYLEVQVSPYGQHLVLLLDGYENPIKQMLPLNYNANISRSSMTWIGTAQIPLSYFPRGVTKMNAYTLHGSGKYRQYEALYPVPKHMFKGPDFHRLDFFQQFNLGDIVKNTTEVGTYWDQLILG